MSEENGKAGKPAVADQRTRRKWVPKGPLPAAEPGKPRLLNGGNPQIPKGDGDGPVQAYIAAMPGWKSAVGARIDRLVMQTCPAARKAVRWNAPFWGMPGQGWMLSLSCVARYVKVAFLQGSSLTPLPPVASKHAGVRYLHIHEDDAFDEALFASWLHQTSALEGVKLF